MRRLLPFALSALACLQSACSNGDEDPTGSNAAALCDDGNPCTFDVWTGLGCRHNLVAVGTPCSLGSLCGAAAECNRFGACLATEPICDDRNDCTSDACVKRGRGWACRQTNLPKGTTCDDRNACTEDDACRGGGKCDGSPVETDDENVCTSDTCDRVTGVQHTPVADGTSCADDDVCNGSEACRSGVCQSGAPLDCDDENVCTIDTCHRRLGCRHRAIHCSDGSACTIDSCDPTLGCTTTPVDCDDNDACTTDSCDDVAGCEHQALTCDDGDLCTNDACDSASGCLFTPISCDDANACTSDACDSQTGACAYQALVNDPCDDNDLCTSNDRCDAAGACGGDDVDPDDANPCTADSCDSTGGISHEAVDPWTPCSDGDPSNGSELCDANGVCVSLPRSESVVAGVGGEDPDVDERQLGEGRHPVAASENGLAAAFYEVLDTGSARVGVATFTSEGVGLGLWRANASILEPDPVVAALPGGGFVAGYSDLFVDGDGLGVVLVRLDANGQQVSSQQIANQTTSFGQHNPDLI